jgi:quinol monooxygenase YgiN
MRRAYRSHYEQLLPSLVTTPREMHLNWRIVRSESQPLDPGSDGREKFPFFVFFHLKPGKEREFRLVLDDLLDRMSEEPSFINYFLLQDENEPTRFVIYETWWGTAEEFSRVEAGRDYRVRYEAAVPELLAAPREIERHWELLYAVDRGTNFR